MVLLDYLNVLRKRWLIIALSTLLVLGGAAAWTFTRTPQYQATTQLFVSVRSGDSSAGELTQGSTYAQQAVSSYVAVADSAIVIDRVRSKLGISEPRRELAKRVSADSPPGTVLINIRATDPDPRQAALIADTTSSVFADVIANQLEGVTEDSPVRVQIDIIQPAEIPEAPISPRAWLNLVLGLVAGLVLGIAIALFRDLVDTKVRTPEDITGVPVIGRVGRNPHPTPLIVATDPTSSLAESYRALRTNLRYMTIEGTSHRVVITSPTAGEGKSTVAANLSIVLADAGAHTILIDGDLRKPTVAKVFGIEGSVGLSDVLIGQVRYQDALQPWGQHDLHLLPAGQIPPNPSELLGSTAMKNLLDELSSTFDYIIIDSPPVLSVTDTAVLSKVTAGTLMVVSSGKVRKAEVGQALESIAQVDGRVLGVVMNRMPTKSTEYYYAAAPQ